MTRWARANNVHRKKVSDATPWEDLKRGAADGGRRNLKKGTPAGGLRRTPYNLGLKNEPYQAKQTKNKKKKDYLNDDVNGFRDFLKQTSQMVQGGKVVAIDSTELMGEVATALRKDERREDRRVKRQVTKKSQMLCFHCRKPGHGLADCKEAHRSQDMGTGICYRCGSTEHDINKCRAKVDPALGEFPFAKCFICGEMGHLSRSCPDNPKGLYGAGGSCRSCGSVEHFQRDCPEHQNSARRDPPGLKGPRVLGKMSLQFRGTHRQVCSSDAKSLAQELLANKLPRASLSPDRLLRIAGNLLER